MTTGDIDAVLREIRDISERLESTSDAEARLELEARRDALRDRARFAAVTGKPLPMLVAELKHTERQLRAIEDTKITPGRTEHMKFITDRSAYRRNINSAIESNNAEKRAELELRRAELLAAIAHLQADS